MNAENTSGFSIANLDKIFLSTAILALFKPFMNVEYFIPLDLTAALIL